MVFSKRKTFLIYTIVSLLILVINRTQMNSVNAYWPTNGWKKSHPLNEKINIAQLNNIDSYFENWNDEHSHSHVDQFVVIRNGFLVKEWYTTYYDAQDIHALWSVTKSFTCTLVGIAINEGFISSVNELVLDFFSDRTIENVDSRKKAITIEHLLMMATGLAYPGDDEIWSGWMNADDQVQYILDLPMATDPGTVYNYDTGGSHLLSAIVQEATGMNTSDFAEEYLFEPLGISHYHWIKDKQGTAFGGHGLHLTPYDMAKLGYLYLKDGVWDGEQLLPNNWVETVTQTQWQFNSDWGYGKQWWTHPYFEGYSAQGRYGQCVFVFPKENVIVVYTGTISDYDSLNVLGIIIDYVFASIITTSELLTLQTFIPLTTGYIVVSIMTIIRIRKKK